MAIRSEQFQNIVSQTNSIDDQLPGWARRSNPIIRRQLGMYWRVMTPEIDVMIRALLIQGGVMLATIYFPPLLTPLLMMVLASVLILPIAFTMYVQLIANVVDDSVSAITQEFQNETLMLLRVTPITLREIVLSKVMASFWRRMETLDNVLMLAVYLGMPAVLLTQILTFPPDKFPVTSQLLVIGIMVVSVIRIPLEIFMIGMLGTMIGTATRLRTPAVIATGVIVFFYFLLLNLPRLLGLPLGLHIIVEMVLPIVIPLLIITLSLRGTLYMLRRD